MISEEQREHASSRLLEIIGAIVAILFIGVASGAAVTSAVYSSDGHGATEYAVRARQWADRIGLRITGVECGSDGMCTIVTEPNRPILVDCGQSASEPCVLKAQ